MRSQLIPRLAIPPSSIFVNDRDSHGLYKGTIVKAPTNCTAGGRKKPRKECYVTSHARHALFFALFATALAGCAESPFAVKRATRRTYLPTATVTIRRTAPHFPYFVLATFSGNPQTSSGYSALRKDALRLGGNAVWIKRRLVYHEPGEWMMWRGHLIHIHGIRSETVQGAIIRIVGPMAAPVYRRNRYYRFPTKKDYVLPVFNFSNVQWYDQKRIAFLGQPTQRKHHYFYVVAPDHVSYLPSYRLLYPSAAKEPRPAQNIPPYPVPGRCLFHGGYLATVSAHGLQGLVLYSPLTRTERWLLKPGPKTRPRSFRFLGWQGGRNAILALSAPRMPNKPIAQVTNRPWRIVAVEMKSGRVHILYQTRNPHVLAGVQAAALSPNGKILVYRTILGHDVSSNLYWLHAGRSHRPRVLLRVDENATNGGPIIWGANGRHFFLMCNSRAACEFSAVGHLQRLMRTPLIDSDLADMKPETHEMLFTHLLDLRDIDRNGIVPSAIEIANFDNSASPAHTQADINNAYDGSTVRSH